MTLKRAETAYVSMGGDLNVSGVAITDLRNTTDTNPIHSYIQENPTAQEFLVEFTHDNTNTWGYGIGIYLNDDDGSSSCYPFFSIEDIHDYIKRYDKYGATTDDLAQAITDFDDTKHLYNFYMTPKLVELGKSAEGLAFCIFALGFGPDYISTIVDEKAGFYIDFTEEETPATRRITNRSVLKPLPLRLNNRIPAR